MLYDDDTVLAQGGEGVIGNSHFLNAFAEVLIDNSGGSADIDGDTLTRGFQREKDTSASYAMARVWAGFAHEGDAVVTEFSPYRCGQSIAQSASKRRYESKSLMDAWAARVHDFIESSTEQ